MLSPQKLASSKTSRVPSTTEERGSGDSNCRIREARFEDARFKDAKLKDAKLKDAKLKEPVVSCASEIRIADASTSVESGATTACAHRVPSTVCESREHLRSDVCGSSNVALSVADASTSVESEASTAKGRTSVSLLTE